MYKDFYGLRERPFDLTSNPRYLLLTATHQEALSNLEYGISTGSGMTLLLGEAGTGKTTLLRKVLAPYIQRSSANRVRWAYVNNPTLSPHEFFDTLEHGFQLSPDAASSKSRFLCELERAFREHRENGILSVLVVDEAQSVPYHLLEELRLLANIETDTGTLLRIVLAGQPEFGDRLNEPGLRQLKQRIGLRCLLPPLGLRETAVYIAHRISLAGGIPARLFSRDAVLAIHERSRGIPRTINVICQNALITGFAGDERPVGPETVLAVCRDFDLQAPTAVLADRLRVPGGPIAQDLTASRSGTAVAARAAAVGTPAGRRFSFPHLSSQGR
jgi:general secretion pathway protein A